MRPSIFPHYTSGFVLTGDEVIELAKHLNITLNDPQDLLYHYSAAWAISRHMFAKDKLLELFNLQPVDLIKIEPGVPGPHSDPEVYWMIPAKSDYEKYDIDPETHESTQKLKAAIVATGIPEQYLSRFETYPNKEYPWTVVNILPPLRLTRPASNGTQPKVKSLNEFLANYKRDQERV
ncbi:hypothetical protein FRC11_009653 [Ceratobasidium sp. 423]|nr:hypothetical protein FRC11_009653 [Ceratobasidium sp. 423]